MAQINSGEMIYADWKFRGEVAPRAFVGFVSGRGAGCSGRFYDWDFADEVSRADCGPLSAAD
jgi:hypothetical protein